MIKMTIQDTEETAEFKVLEKPIIQKPLIAESDVITIDNNLSTYVTGTQKRELTVGLGYLDSVGYETLRRIRDRQYAVLKYPTVTITADEPVDLGYGEDVPDNRQRLVQLKGKNLLDSTTLVAGYVLNTGQFSENSQLGEMRSGFIEVTPNTTYTFSIQATTSSYDNWFGVGEYTTSDTSGFIERITQTTATTYTFVTSAACRYIVVSARNLANATKVQLELSSTVTPYSSYFEPIELCKIGDYQDYIYKSDDKWYVHKTIGKLELNRPTSISRLNTALTNTQSMYRWATYYEGETLPTSSSSSALIPIYCSHFEAKTRLNTFNNIQGIAPPAPADTGTQTVIFYASSLAQSSAEDVTTWLNNNNPVVYYQLATSTETEITNATLIAQLDALQNSAFDRWTGVETEVQELSPQPYLTVTQGEITGSGKEVMLNGTTEDLLDFVILGDTYQQTYSGKNLINVNGNLQSSSQGLNFEANADGSFRLYGTASITYANVTTSISVSLSSGTYTFSVKEARTHRVYFRVWFANNTYEDWVLEPSADSVTKTFTQNITALRLDLSRLTPNTYYNESLSVQLEKTSTATTFEPYVGGVPSPNPDYPQKVQTVNGDINFDFSGPSGVKRYTMVGKMTLADQRIIDNCGTNEQVQVSFRESKQI